MNYKGFQLDQFQEDSILAIESNHSVVVSAPTGSGKTLIADYIINRDIKKNTRVIYTAPIKALLNQKYRDFVKEYGEQCIGLLTGDTVRNPDAQILLMTTEIYRNMAISKDSIIEKVSYVIFDEIHYLNDIERGTVWEESIIFSHKNTRFLCLSATIPNADEFAGWVSKISNHKVIVVRHDMRPVPLEQWFYEATIGIAKLEEIKDIADIPDYDSAMNKRGKRREKKGPSHLNLVQEIKDKLPCLFFMFSRRKCEQSAVELAKKKIFPYQPEIVHLVRQKLSSAPPEVARLESTKMLRETLCYGIGFHHAGQLAVIKEMVEELFSKGLLNVLYVTETFAVGINMPAKTVCFESLRKYDGISFRPLNSKEYFQIAGRAGRRGIDSIGYVYTMVDLRDFDYGRYRAITESDNIKIQSQFKLSVNTVLNLIDKHSDSEIQEILCKSFYAFQRYGPNYEVDNQKIQHSFMMIRKKLEKLGYVSGNILTEKGRFSSRIYSDEIVLGELFSGNWYLELDNYQILLVLACLCFEKGDKVEFYKSFPSKKVMQLKKMLLKNAVARTDARFKELEHLSSIIHPLCAGASIFDFFANSSIPEGDLVRFLRQILDRVCQIHNASSDFEVRRRMDDCRAIIVQCIEKVDPL